MKYWLRCRLEICGNMHNKIDAQDLVVARLGFFDSSYITTSRWDIIHNSSSFVYHRPRASSFFGFHLDRAKLIAPTSFRTFCAPSTDGLLRDSIICHSIDVFVPLSLLLERSSRFFPRHTMFSLFHFCGFKQLP